MEEKETKTPKVAPEAKAPEATKEAPKENKDASKATSEKKVAATPAKAGAATPRTGNRKFTPRSGGDRRGGAAGGRRPGGGGKRGNRRGGRPERQKSEFDQKIISIRRVTRVVSGGRRFGFSVALVAGNRNGKVGVGVGKATDTALAIEKAFKSAKKNMVEVKRTKEKSIPHEIQTKYNSSVVFIKPSPGKGIVAGSSVRNVLDLCGVTDVVSKIHTRSKNKINIARATVQALKEIS